MSEAYVAQKIFKQEWKDWQNGKLKKSKKSKKQKGNVEPEAVTKARNEFWARTDLLYDSKLGPLEVKFRENPRSALPELIEFLLVDIPAFRTGYAKEVFLRWLKNVALLPSEIEGIQRAALKMCETKNIRREFRHWCRLMIKLADADFVLELKPLAESDDSFTRRKAKQMSELIKKHRADLREIQ